VIIAEDTPERLQSRVTGSQRVLVRIRGDEDGLKDVIAGIPGVSMVHAGEEGGLEFETAAGEDVRPQVARVLIQAGYDLLEMRPIGVSLEDIFLQLTRDEPKPPEIDEEIESIEVADEIEEAEDYEE
jgi:ABC-2 type transport system ATP-binding protein